MRDVLIHVCSINYSHPALLSQSSVQGVGDPPSEVVSRHPTGSMVRAASHVRGTGGGRAGVEEVDARPRNAQRASQATYHSGENPPLPDRLVEQLKASDWEDRQKAITVLEQFVDQYPKALEPHMHKVHVCIYMILPT